MAGKRNDPSAPYDRPIITERHGPIKILCTLETVDHVRLRDGTRESVLVLRFQFNPAKPHRRIICADISLKFSSREPIQTTLKVLGFSFDGRYAVLTTCQAETTTRGGDLNANVGQFGLGLGSSVKWEKTAVRNTTDQTPLSGSRIGNDFGKGVGVEWAFCENGTTKTGIPSTLNVAVRLQRSNDCDFQCELEIKTKADCRTWLRNLFVPSPKDDPVLFHPRQSERDVDEEVDISAWGNVTWHTTIKNPIKKVRMSHNPLA
ncbi:hypothetical protein QBC46DRAFT_103324 [Diplogelasinospora grovesii]|uniref:Uncharacterized protein n=1 Tax=Diplogelasinospora grovesii TaxID=303347 RepID=A0AAN6MUK2_9PEZI|nr:hypothetical protein QBC46DRAFT_103324 [Diplogelasinospora grovesii]